MPTDPATAVGRSPDRLLHSINEALTLVPISKTKLYQLIADGTVATVSIGSRRLIPHEALVDLAERGTGERSRVEPTEYARRRVAETCAEQGVDVDPPESVREVVASMIGGSE
jgi:excisionase family DNA binding protein